jgi:hypothetical protein
MMIRSKLQAYEGPTRFVKRFWEDVNVIVQQEDLEFLGEG